MNNGDQTNHEILEAISEFSTHVDKRFDGIDKRFDAVDKRFDGLDSRVMRLEALMVTKDYLDDKLADLKGDILTVIRKEDRRVSSLIDLLRTKNILNDDEVDGLGKLQPLVPIPQ